MGQCHRNVSQTNPSVEIGATGTLLIKSIIVVPLILQQCPASSIQNAWDDRVMFMIVGSDVAPGEPKTVPFVFIRSSLDFAGRLLFHSAGCLTAYV
jgi:hypothetical protein